MALIYMQFHTEGIALLSYLIGDDSTGEAALIDPRSDPEIYLEEARSQGVAITHILETHIHADFMSGSRELAAQSPGAKIYCSSEGGADYGFEHESLRDGDKLVLGDVVLTARHTPGHTPEHMSYEVAEKDRNGDPWGVFTGDSLFIGSAGRPDLLGADEAKDLANQLYETLYGYFAKLPDGALVLPGHGAGSPCGASIGDRMISSIQYEKKTNEFLQLEGQREEFVELALNAPDEPRYYSRMKKLNAAGPEPTLGLPYVRGLNPAAFREAVQDPSAVNLIDTRSIFAFGGAHVPGAINIWDKPMLSLWAGWMADPEKETYLILEDDTKLSWVTRLLLRVGLAKIGGYLIGGMDAWATAGERCEELPQISVHEVATALERGDKDFQLLDVRSEDEADKSRIGGAKHIFVADIAKKADEELNRSQTYVTYCGTGYRASIAASVLQQMGFENVRNLPGSWEAWQNLKQS